MNGKNAVQLIGYVGRDLKESKQDSGLTRVAIRMATHQTFKNRLGEQVNATTWHNVVAWDGSAEYARRSFVKGSKILVEGSIVYGSFTGWDGRRRFTTHIKATNLINLDR